MPHGTCGTLAPACRACAPLCLRTDTLRGAGDSKALREGIWSRFVHGEVKSVGMGRECRGGGGHGLKNEELT